MTYKIVGTSNFDRETQDDILVAFEISDKEYADVMCKAMNDKFSGDQATYFFKVVDNNYILHRWEP